ncbi:hypothetical protein [Arenimonas sp.]|uniref:hypothetical protein n=1 Tax=Arenimonas sp. TaxID=1872635 RepID=UPI0035B3B244
MKTRRIEVTDEAGARTQVLERISQIDTGSFDGPGSKVGLSTFHGPDGETLNSDGDAFVGIHSGKRYKRA